MNTKPTIYLHIGAGKTGTTSIQTWLKHNEHELQAHGYLIFDSHFKPNSINELMSNQQKFFYNILRDEDGGKSAFQSQFHENLAYMRANNYHSAVISAELIITSLPQLAFWFEPFIDECNWKIIAYVRNQAHYLVSSWKEWGYWQQSFDELFDNVKYLHANWHQMLQSWQHVFGTEHIYLGIFEKSYLVNHSIIHDFATAINAPHLVQQAHNEILTNPSLSNKSALFLSNIRHHYTKRTSARYTKPNQSDFDDQHAYHIAHRKYIERIREDFQLKPLLINRARSTSTQEHDNALSIATQAQLDAIYDQFNASNARLLAQYRPDVDIDIAFPRVITTNHVEYTDDEIIYHGFYMLFEMIKGMNTQHISQNEIIKLQSEQIAVLNTKLRNQTHALWNANRAHQESLVQVQAQFAEVQRQLQQVQQQFIDLNFASRDLYSRTNPVKYWIIRIWNRIFRRAK